MNLENSQINSIQFSKPVASDSVISDKIDSPKWDDRDLFSLDLIDYQVRIENVARNPKVKVEELSLCTQIEFPPGFPFTKEYFPIVWNGDNNSSQPDPDFIDRIKQDSNNYKAACKNYTGENLIRANLFERFKPMNFQPDGLWQPNCLPKSKMAIIIPFRSQSAETDEGREVELTFYLYRMIPLLQLQNIEFKIYVIEQDWKDQFNRARLLNIGAELVEKEYPKYFNCLFLTDVDKLIINYNISLHCNSHSQVVHYPSFLGSYGGFAQISTESFFKMDGITNAYYGWGGEDQDMGYRVGDAFKRTKGRISQMLRDNSLQNLTTKYLNMNPYKKLSLARWYAYPSIFTETGGRGKGTDKGNEKNKESRDLMRSYKTRVGLDGLHSLKYQLLKTTKENLFTRYLVSFDQESDKKLETTLINFEETVYSHCCLNSLETLEKCYNGLSC